MNLTVNPVSTSFKAMYIIEGNKQSVEQFQQRHWNIMPLRIRRKFSDCKFSTQDITDLEYYKKGNLRAIIATEEDAEALNSWRKKYGPIIKKPGNRLPERNPNYKNDVNVILKQLKKFTKSTIETYKVGELIKAMEYDYFDPVKGILKPIPKYI